MRIIICLFQLNTGIKVKLAFSLVQLSLYVCELLYICCHSHLKLKLLPCSVWHQCLKLCVYFFLKVWWKLLKLSMPVFLWQRTHVHEITVWNFWCNWWLWHSFLFLCGQWNVWPWPCEVPLSSQLCSPVKNPCIESTQYIHTHTHTFY